MKRLAARFVLVGLAACGGGGSASLPPPPSNLPTPDVSSVAAADPGSTLADGWQQGAVMQIFVRSYRDSDGNGSGDLRGLASRLDYLQDLGVKGLWLMPVTKSQDRDHGYAVADYRDIETDYGSLADFDALLRQAHARGIGVMLDYVVNHSAATNPVFVNSRDSASNAYRDWYVWQPTVPSGWNVLGGNPWRGTANGAYYAPFWDQMPDWNLGNAAVANYHRSNLRFWLNRGVDGLRFDAVGLLFENGPTAWENQPQNYTLMADLRSVVEGYARRTMVCEAPADPRGFALACGSAFGFDLNASLIAAARGDTAATARVAGYFRSAPASMSTFLSNHDAFAGQRVWDQLGGNLAQMKLAAASYLLLPGRPFIYYGEEIGRARRRRQAAHADELERRHRARRLHHRHPVPSAVGQRGDEQRRRAKRRSELAARVLQGDARAAQHAAVDRARQLRSGVRERQPDGLPARARCRAHGRARQLRHGRGDGRLECVAGQCQADGALPERRRARGDGRWRRQRDAQRRRAVGARAGRGALTHDRCRPAGRLCV